MSSPFKLVESAVYTACLSAIGDVERVDAALNALTWAIATNPNKYPLIPGFQRLRVGKTKSFVWDGGVIPPLRVLFSIRPDALGTVDLWHVEMLEIPEQELPF
jgi:hypothetical protein